MGSKWSRGEEKEERKMHLCVMQRPKEVKREDSLHSLALSKTRKYPHIVNHSWKIDFNCCFLSLHSCYPFVQSILLWCQGAQCLHIQSERGPFNSLFFHYSAFIKAGLVNHFFLSELHIDNEALSGYCWWFWHCDMTWMYLGDVLFD